MNDTVSTGWRRVTKADPCKVCGKPDWCTRGDRYHCCMRVQSPKPAENGGWLHPIDGAGAKPITRPARQAPTIHCADYLEPWYGDLQSPTLHLLAARLGVAENACRYLGAVWARQFEAWAWPMKDAYGNYVGIRLRADDGRKWAVKGSRQGLFLPAIPGQEVAYVCEGPTDTAAAISMGLYAVGRPSCLGCENEVRTLFKRLDVRRAVIISDSDTPGFEGARRLSASLHIPSVILVPPAKDMRAFYQAGGTREMLNAQASDMIWNIPKK